MSFRSTQSLPWYFQGMLIIYILHTSMPVVGFYTPAIANAAVLLFLYSYLFFKNREGTIADAGYVLPIFSIYILSLLYEGTSHWASSIYGLMQIFIYPLLALYLIRSGDGQSVRRIFLIIILSYMVTGITTYQGCKMFPSASRDIAAQLTSEDPGQYAMYMSYNIGSFSFIYTLVLIMPLLIYMMKDKKIKLVIGLAYMLIIIMTVLESEYATALLFLIVCSMTVFLPKYFGRKEILWIILGALLFFAFGKLFISQIFESLANVVNSETVADRFHNLAIFFSGEMHNVDGDVESRMDLYKRSVDAFLESPIWGAGNISVGGHSYVLDNLGKYGLVGFVAMIIMYVRLFKIFFKSYANQKWYGYVWLLFLVALIFAVLNPKDNLIVLTLLVPLFVVSYKERLHS